MEDVFVSDDDSYGVTNYSIFPDSVYDGLIIDNTTENASLSCERLEVSDEMNFIFHGVGILVLGLFGVSANVLSVIVLSHPGLKSSLTTLLLGLTISDIFVMVTAVFIFSLKAIFDYLNICSIYNDLIYPYITPWLFPITLTAQMSSIYFTVMITLERYIAVRFPLRARSLCTRSTAKKSSIVVLVMAVLYNIPRWFEYHTVPNPSANETGKYIETGTELRHNDTYILYYVNWGYFVVIYLIPFTILLVFNSAIYQEAKKVRSRRLSLCPTGNPGIGSSNEDRALTAMLFAIVITFIACNMLSLVINVMEAFFGVCNFGDLIPISNFLISFCCFSNFVFYCVFGTKFRRRLLHTLGMKRFQSNPSPQTPPSLCRSSVSMPYKASQVRRNTFGNIGANNNVPGQGHQWSRGRLSSGASVDLEVGRCRGERSVSQHTVQTIISEDL